MSLERRFQLGFDGEPSSEAGLVMAGDVATLVKADGTREPVNAGGGSQTEITVSFPFAFNTPGLADGLTAYTFGANGGYLRDATMRVSTAFDGTTPLGEIGNANGGLFATMAYTGAFVDLSQVWADYFGDGTAFSGLVGNTLGISNAAEIARLIKGSFSIATQPVLPLFFEPNAPLLVWASQSGAIGGDPVGGAAGAAELLLTIGLPA